MLWFWRGGESGSLSHWHSGVPNIPYIFRKDKLCFSREEYTQGRVTLPGFWTAWWIFSLAALLPPPPFVQDTYLSSCPCSTLRGYLMAGKLLSLSSKPKYPLVKKEWSAKDLVSYQTYSEVLWPEYWKSFDVDRLGVSLHCLLHFEELIRTRFAYLFLESAPIKKKSSELSAYTYLSPTCLGIPQKQTLCTNLKRYIFHWKSYSSRLQSITYQKKFHKVGTKRKTTWSTYHYILIENNYEFI